MAISESKQLNAVEELKSDAVTSWQRCSDRQHWRRCRQVVTDSTQQKDTMRSVIKRMNTRRRRLEHTRRSRKRIRWRRRTNERRRIIWLYEQVVAPPHAPLPSPFPPLSLSIRRRVGASKNTYVVFRRRRSRGCQGYAHMLSAWSYI